MAKIPLTDSKRLRNYASCAWEHGDLNVASCDVRDADIAASFLGHEAPLADLQRLVRDWEQAHLDWNALVYGLNCGHTVPRMYALGADFAPVEGRPRLRMSVGKTADHAFLEGPEEEPVATYGLNSATSVIGDLFVELKEKIVNEHLPTDRGEALTLATRALVKALGIDEARALESLLLALDIVVGTPQTGGFPLRERAEVFAAWTGKPEPNREDFEHGLLSADEAVAKAEGRVAGVGKHLVDRVLSVEDHEAEFHPIWQAARHQLALALGVPRDDWCDLLQVVRWRKDGVDNLLAERKQLRTLVAQLRAELADWKPEPV